MEAIILDGFLDEETVPGDLHCTTARFRLTVSPTDERADEAVMPCTVTDPLIAHAVIHDLQPGDHLRVTGTLRLPRTPDDVMWLQVQALEVLASSPLRELGTDTEDLADDPDAPDSVDGTGPAANGSTLPDDGFLDRYGVYIAYTDPDTSQASVWTEAGAWVGAAIYPVTIGDLIDAYERRSTPGP